jgi:murein hydrolase activator
VIFHSTPTPQPSDQSSIHPDFARLLPSVQSRIECKDALALRIVLTRLLSLAFCCLTLLNVAYASQQEELENLRKRIAIVQNELDKTSESKSEAADALRESERAISDSNRKLAELAALQRAADQKLGKLHAQQEKMNDDMAVQRALFGKLLYQQYLGGKHEYLKLLLNNQDPNQVARDLRYYQYIARNRADWLESLRQSLAELDAISTSTRDQRAELASLREEQATQKKKLEQEQRARQRTLVKVSQQLHRQRREITRLQRDENRLAELVDKLTKMLAEPKSNSLFHNENLPDDRFDGRPFDQLKGKLALPVKGVITNRFGTPRPDSRVQWKGLFLRTSSGQAVKAIAAGRVVFADWLRGFGNLLIIDHGKGYMSLYANNETLYKQVGDVLSGGDIVATVGNTGGNEDFGLYFELRHESKPLDPMKWMATK